MPQAALGGSIEVAVDWHELATADEHELEYRDVPAEQAPPQSPPAEDRAAERPECPPRRRTGAAVGHEPFALLKRFGRPCRLRPRDLGVRGVRDRSEREPCQQGRTDGDESAAHECSSVSSVAADGFLGWPR